ncbi:TPA: DUF308 domain-containing protein [Listeria innocua]|uniref:DUF308 domain-containing protein n=1 Tax=Listeria innocua TaxID=1642 RepID=UPI0012C8603D|nr:DUF308 domain-containing protein [Listeria innocua]QPQ97017.1 DUF308 domain-containing protein [Listeria welshimeri]ECL7896071.1 DUF308 domain-containing protein [Listeria innocua]ECX4531256.1 DUF308 domain-containing protein [Listeria innocua]ECX5123781.1 DUF308 domain-containing protein [Listeria innocua]EHF3638565.1 DUF308 domain-containing protein [Listeria innocua]
MTGFGTILLLVGTGVLIYGLISFRKKKWPRRKTQIVIISSILAIFIGAAIVPSEKEEASTEKPKQEEKTKKATVEPLLKAEKTFKTTDDGAIVVEGKTNPGAEVMLDFVDNPDPTATADEDGKFSLRVNELDRAQDAVLSITIDGKTKEQTLSLEMSPGYQKKLADKAEAERVAAEKAEAERVERERVAAEEKRIADEKAAEKRAAEAKVAAEKAAAEKKAAEAKRAEAKRSAPKPDTSNKQGETVYITATGKKYHYDQNCRGLNNSNGETAVTIAEAKSRGLSLCKFEQ